jgi:hypothetical protein
MANEFLDYVNEFFVNSDLVTLDGLNLEGLHYVAVRKSDGKPLSETIWPLNGQILYLGGTFGTIAELRERGVSWERIFPAAVEACSRVHPIDVKY